MLLESLHTPLVDIRKGLRASRDLLAQSNGRAFNGVISDVDRRIAALYPRLEACRRYVSVNRRSVHTAYNPAHLLKSQSGFMPMPVSDLPARPVPPLDGDTQQILDILRIIWSNAAIGANGQVTTALFMEGEGPRVAIGIAGEGSFPTRYRIGDEFELSLEELDERWHDATRGGYIAGQDQLLTLVLVGDEYAPSTAPNLKEQADLLARATRKLMPWRTASGSYEEGLVHPGDTKQLYAESLDEAIEAISEVIDRN